MLKTALNMKGPNPSNGINLCDWVKLGLLEKKGENATYRDLLLFQQCF